MLFRKSYYDDRWGRFTLCWNYSFGHAGLQKKCTCIDTFAYAEPFKWFNRSIRSWFKILLRCQMPTSVSILGDKEKCFHTISCSTGQLSLSLRLFWISFAYIFESCWLLNAIDIADITVLSNEYSMESGASYSVFFIFNVDAMQVTVFDPLASIHLQRVIKSLHFWILYWN